MSIMYSINAYFIKNMLMFVHPLKHNTQKRCHSTQKQVTKEIASFHVKRTSTQGCTPLSFILFPVAVLEEESGVGSRLIHVMLNCGLALMSKDSTRTAQTQLLIHSELHKFVIAAAWWGGKHHEESLNRL